MNVYLDGSSRLQGVGTYLLGFNSKGTTVAAPKHFVTCFWKPIGDLYNLKLNRLAFPAVSVVSSIVVALSVLALDFSSITGFLFDAQAFSRIESATCVSKRTVATCRT